MARRLDHDYKFVMKQRAPVGPPIKISNQASPSVAVVIEPDASMSDLDIACRPVFPEIDSSNALMPKPDRLVMLVTDRIRMPKSGKRCARRPDQREDERPRGVFTNLIACTLDSVDA